MCVKEEKRTGVAGVWNQPALPPSKRNKKASRPHSFLLSDFVSDKSQLELWPSFGTFLVFLVFAQFPISSFF